MFEKERFIEECRAALKELGSHAAVRELVARIVSEPTQLVRVLGEPRRAGVETIYKPADRDPVSGITLSREFYWVLKTPGRPRQFRRSYVLVR
jgi:hypothetical protein